MAKSIFPLLCCILLMGLAASAQKKPDSVKYTFTFYDETNRVSVDSGDFHLFKTQFDYIAPFTKGVVTIWLQKDTNYLVWASRQGYTGPALELKAGKDSAHRIQLKLNAPYRYGPLPDSVKYTFTCFDYIHGFTLDSISYHLMDSKGGDRTISFKDTVQTIWLKPDRKYIVVPSRGKYLPSADKALLDPAKDNRYNYRFGLRKYNYHGDYIPAPHFKSHSTHLTAEDSSSLQYYVSIIKHLAKEDKAWVFAIYVYSDYDEHHDSVLSVKRTRAYCKILADSGIPARKLIAVYKPFYPYIVDDDPDFPDDTQLTDDYVKTLPAAKREKANAYNRRTCVYPLVKPIRKKK